MTLNPTYIHYINAILTYQPYFLHISNPAFLIFLQLRFLSNVIYKSPQKSGSKNGVFSLFFCSKQAIEPLYVVVKLHYFSSEPQYVIRIILSTCPLQGNTSKEKTPAGEPGFDSAYEGYLVFI